MVPPPMCGRRPPPMSNEPNVIGRDASWYARRRPGGGTDEVLLQLLLLLLVKKVKVTKQIVHAVFFL